MDSPTSADLLPKEFVQRLQMLLPKDRLDSVLDSFFRQKQATFRINTLKNSVDGSVHELKKQGFLLEEVTWMPGAFVLKNRDLPALQETENYKRGELYIQNLSSMLPVILLNPQPGETVLDMTAAPGSKTTQIAMHMQGQGVLIANDNHRQRFFKMKSILGQQGVQNIQISCKYGESFGKTHPGFFDKILLDAPCSTEGRFSMADPDSFRYWKPSKCKEMARKQKRLILSAVESLKPGGVLVYSTCTFAPEENEEVLNWMLQKVGPQIAFEKINLPFANIQMPLTEWEGKLFSEEIQHAVRILPDESMECFFVAKMIKQDICR